MVARFLATSVVQAMFILGLGAAALGCASNLECSGPNNCICRSGVCRQSCPGGGCNLQCMGTDCELECTGGGCNLDCGPGADRCVITGCTTGCNLDCGGAAECMSSCGAASACLTSP
jgi:hypothetical protein